MTIVCISVGQRFAWGKNAFCLVYSVWTDYFQPCVHYFLNETFAIDFFSGEQMKWFTVFFQGNIDIVLGPIIILSRI